MSDEAKALARERYEQGVKAYSDGRYKDAIDLFLEGDGIAESASFAYNIGLSYEKMGDASKALGWSREYLRRKPDAGDRDEVVGRIRGYEQKLRSKGVQQVTLLSSPAGATIVVDGRPLGVTPWTGELAPGVHELHLRLRGYEDGQLRFMLNESRAMDVSLALEEMADATSPPPLPPAPEGAPPPTADTTTAGPAIGPLTWIAAGVGVACLGVAVGLEVARAGAEQDALDEPVQLDAAERYDEMESLQLASRVMLGVGVATTVAAGVLLVLDLTSEDEEAGVAWGLDCGPLRCVASAGLRF